MSTKPAPPQPVTPLSETPLEAAYPENNGFVAICDFQLNHRGSTTLDTIVTPQHTSNASKQPMSDISTAHKYPSDPYLCLVDRSLTNRLTAHGIDLNKIDIATLSLSVGTVNSLKRANIAFTDGPIQLAPSSAVKPSLTGPEKVFFNMVLSDGPIVSYEAGHHQLLEAGFSTWSVISLLRYSPVVQKITDVLDSLLGTKYDEIDIQEAQ